MFSQLVFRRAQIKKLEASEKRLKDIVMDKDSKLDEERLEFKRLLNSEQRLVARDPNVMDNKAQNSLSRSLIHGNSPGRQGENIIPNRSVMARIDQHREENVFKEVLVVLLNLC